MRFLFGLLAPAILAAQSSPAPDARELLLRSGTPLLTAKMVRLSGTRKVEIISGAGPPASFASTFSVSFARDGRARLESGPPNERVQVWDGANAWDYSPRTKSYAKTQAKTAPDPIQIATLKFGRVDGNIVSAKIERQESLELSGKPAICYVVRADYTAAPGVPSARNTVRTAWISRDSLVLRDIWEYDTPAAGELQTRLTISYTSIDWTDALAADVFTFAPPEGATLRTGPNSTGNPMPQMTPLREGVYRAGGGVTAPQVLYRIEPGYTEEARAARLQGDIMLALEVGPDGKATNIRVVRGLGLGLDQQAIEAVGKWRFQPGTKDGKPVTVFAQVVVSFRLL